MEAKWSRTTIPVPASGLGAHTLQLGDDKRETLDKGRESLCNSPPTTYSSNRSAQYQMGEETYIIGTRAECDQYREDECGQSGKSE